MEQQIKEFALVGFVTALFSILAALLIKQYTYWLFMGHTQYWEIPPWELCIVIWIAIMYFLYIRQIAIFLVKKEMGVLQKNEEDLKDG